MGAALPKPVCTTVLERHGSPDFRVGLAEMNGWRMNMEDAHVVHTGDGEGFFGILDGHGSAECSAWCAQRLHEVLAAHGCPTNDAAAKKMCLDIDAAFLRTGKSGGTTAAMCAVRRPAPGGKYRLHVINAGDSRVLLSRANGSIIDGGGTDGGLTTDHKPNHPVERERIERCGGQVVLAAGGVHRVNGGLSVSRGFGDGEYKKTGGPSQEDRPVTANPEMGHFECDSSDFLVIVCDGVSEGAFTNAEVCELAAKVLKETNGDVAKAAEAVILRALDRNSKDNISCMIVLFGGPPAGSGRAMGRHRESSTSFSAGNAPAAFTLGKQRELQPGSLVGSENASFVKAYVVMCERGGMSFAEATEKRYELLLKRKGTPAAREEDETELELIGKPEGAEGSAQRKGWFEQWAKRCQERSDEERRLGPLSVGQRIRVTGDDGLSKRALLMAFDGDDAYEVEYEAGGEAVVPAAKCSTAACPRLQGDARCKVPDTPTRRHWAFAFRDGADKGRQHR